MHLGILSDTHDDEKWMNFALLALRQRGASYIIHCGDIGTPRMLDFMVGSPCGFIWGNSDKEPVALMRHAASIGIHCFEYFGEFEMAGKMFAVVHGDDRARMKALLEDQRHDYLLCGHTHVCRDERVGRIRMINPGALYEAKERTCAILHVEEDRLEMIRLD